MATWPTAAPMAQRRREMRRGDISAWGFPFLGLVLLPICRGSSVCQRFCFYIGSPTASPYLRPRRASRVWGWVGEVVRIYYTYRLVGVCVCVCVWSGLCPTSDCPTWDSPDPTEPARVPLARALSRWCCCCGRRARACAPTRACARCRVAQAPGQKLVVADSLGLAMPVRRRGGSR